MLGIFSPYFERLRKSYQSNDIVDRLNHDFTALLLFTFGVTLTATQYVGKPIQCWVPATFTEAWEQYTEKYCFITGSYFLLSGQDIDHNQTNVISYYQWAPLVLAIQAFLFYFPSIVWCTFNFNTGINIRAILDSAAEIKKTDDLDSRTNQVKAAAAHITETLKTQREIKVGKLELTRRMLGSGFYLCGLYIITKFLYILNIMIQFVILALFLDTNSSFWGFEILSDLVAGREWQETGNFPRVTLCDFEVLMNGYIHGHTVQCFLRINMYTEKIYVFFWFWFAFVLMLSVLSMTYWFMALSLPFCHRNYISKYLHCTEAISNGSKSDDRLVTEFVRDFLTNDGVFLCRLIQTNGGDVIAGEIINELCRTFLKKNEEETGSPSVESPDSTATA